MMEFEIKAEPITTDEWEMLPELKLEYNSLENEDDGITTAEQCRDATVPVTSDDSERKTPQKFPKTEYSSTETDIEDSCDTFQTDMFEVCPSKSEEKEVEPCDDSTQKTENEPECLGPFYQPTRCPTCSEEISGIHAAKQHSCFRKSLVKKRFSSSQPPRSRLKCNLCHSIEYSCPRAYTRHVLGHFSQLYFLCSICDKKFRTRTTFVSHSYTHSGRWPYRCKVCGMGSASQSALETHEALHSDQKSAVCEICGEAFKTKKSLTQHQELHEGKIHQCTFCNKVYRTTKSLKKHLELHKTAREGKKYKCDLCDNVYANSTALKFHKDKSHFGKERPNKYLCNICNKSMKTRGQLEIHFVTHTGEKHYTCDICKRKFSTKVSVARHIAEHSGEKNFSCGVCGMKFTQKSSVKRHVDNVHN